MNKVLTVTTTTFSTALIPALGTFAHHDAAADQAPHVFDLLGEAWVILLIIAGVFGAEVGEEEDDVADDGDSSQRVEGDGHELGAGSRAHVCGPG